ncbi:dTDP-4-dehydrorhamnose reductase [Fusibacter sp. 3D3]|uniref:dTDP-4-dehydrorhamnose reductase n=1 Tax=Fusibacter sp. 3D3 TaxID=1048380 RepID=UPI000856255F|nr:dTDP-4-dehydrorhamnose reductase [Fusibacter sp. 3D3]GAU77775.1 dTDP-4-dehydrorhamnose 3,5-epimerase [Fusibacter sp. 3D3]
MKIIKTEFKGLLIIETDVFGDNRGWFSETYTKSKFADAGIDIDFIQDNQSFSQAANTLRGLHCQTDPKAQTKMIRCTRGRIIDTVVDLRKGSDTYKKWLSIELSEENKRQFLIPKGFAHAFLTLTDNVEVQYKVDEYYSKENDRSIAFNDPEFAIDWEYKNPILSDKDRNAPFYAESDIQFSIKVLVTGASGQLGYDVVRKLNQLGIKNYGASTKDFNITNILETEQFIQNYNPDVVIHCAAYTAVDLAETEKNCCHQINVDGTRNIVNLCKKINAKMLYVSSDYVFDGSGDDPHREDEDTKPINYYGYTKEQGEKVVRETLDNYYIVRTSWVYGKNGNNFVKTMLKLSETKKELNVVSDQIGAPTYTKDLAEFICELIQTKAYGIYHGVNGGYCSWYEFSKSIFKHQKLNIEVNPVLSSEYKTTAKRPFNSRLSTHKTDLLNIYNFPNWEDALVRFLNELKE